MTEATTFADLAAEIRHHYARGRILIAVDGADPASTGRFADALAESLGASEPSAFRASAPAETYRHDDDRAEVRTLLSRFRGGTAPDGRAVPEDAVLVVDGRFLLSPRLRGAWHFRVWLDGDAPLTEAAFAAQTAYVRDDAPRAAADAIYGLTGPRAPMRVWADSC